MYHGLAESLLIRRNLMTGGSQMLRVAVYTTAFIVIASASLTLALNGNAGSARAVASGSSSGGMAEPFITASASPDSGGAGDQVTVSFSSGSDLDIVGCSAQFSEGPATTCTSSGSESSVELTVPENATAGGTYINWHAFYRYTNPPEPCCPEPVSPEPCCPEPVSPEPGPKVNSLQNATGSGGEQEGEESGTINFTVLAGSGTQDGGGGNLPGENTTTGPSRTPGEALEESPGDIPSAQPGLAQRSDNGPLLIGIPLLIGLLLVAGIIAARMIRRARGRSKRPPADQQVRAVPHIDPHIRVTTHPAHRGGSHVVRLEPRNGIEAVDIQEVIK
jgi:hypothetical protein